MECHYSWFRFVFLRLIIFSLSFSIVTPYFFGFGSPVEVPDPNKYGECSWYGPPSKPPHRMANGNYIRPDLMTAAHKTLPLGTRAVVTNTDNGKSVQVVITDRGPFVVGRIAALTSGAFSSIGDLDQQVFPCTVIPM